MLIYFVIDLARDPGLRSRFEQDPGAVLKEYSLSREEQEILASGSRRKIERHLRSSIAEILDTALGPSSFFPWPGNPIEILSVEPPIGPVNIPLTLRIEGEYFPSEVEVLFSRGVLRVQGVDPVVHNVGTNHSWLTVTAVFTEAGAYTLTLVATENLEDQSTFANAFTAED